MPPTLVASARRPLQAAASLASAGFMSLEVVPGEGDDRRDRRQGVFGGGGVGDFVLDPTGQIGQVDAGALRGLRPRRSASA